MDKKQIWDFFINQGLSKAGVAGIMGNIQAESEFKFNNLQNTGNKKLGMTDEQYTAAVDSGLYKDFVMDGNGYGAVQTTYYTRKQNLLDFARKRNVSISDPQMQLDFIMFELKTFYKVLHKTLQTTTSVKTASDMFLTVFEKPADQSEKIKNLRYSYSMNFYNEYANKSTISSSSTTPSESHIDVLSINTNYPCHKSNYGGKRASKIEWIVIHYTGNKTDKAINNAKYFQSPNKHVSAHYFVDPTSIYQSVPDDYVAWAVGKKYGNAKYWNLCNNRNSLSIELCSNNSQISEATQDNAVKLIKQLMQKYNIDVNHIIRHYDVCLKNCPGWTLNTEQGWRTFLNKITNSCTTIPKAPYKVQVNSPKSPLNIRSGPGISFIPIGQLNNGDIVEICEEKNGFLRLNDTDKWISSKYVKEVN